MIEETQMSFCSGVKRSFSVSCVMLSGFLRIKRPVLDESETRGPVRKPRRTYFRIPNRV